MLMTDLGASLLQGYPITGRLRFLVEPANVVHTIAILAYNLPNCPDCVPKTDASPSAAVELDTDDGKPLPLVLAQDSLKLEVMLLHGGQLTAVSLPFSTEPTGRSSISFELSPAMLEAQDCLMLVAIYTERRAEQLALLRGRPSQVSASLRLVKKQSTDSGDTSK